MDEKLSRQIDFAIDKVLKEYGRSLRHTFATRIYQGAEDVYDRLRSKAIETCMKEVPDGSWAAASYETKVKRNVCMNQEEVFIVKRLIEEVERRILNCRGADTPRHVRQCIHYLIDRVASSAWSDYIDFLRRKKEGMRLTIMDYRPMLQAIARKYGYYIEFGFHIFEGSRVPHVSVKKIKQGEKK